MYIQRTYINGEFKSHDVVSDDLALVLLARAFHLSTVENVEVDTDYEYTDPNQTDLTVNSFRIIRGIEGIDRTVTTTFTKVDVREVTLRYLEDK